MNDKGKAIVAFLYAVAVIAVPVFSGGRATPSAEEWVQIGIAVVTAASVYLAPLVPSATWVKTLIGALLAGLQVLATAVLGGIDGNDVLLIVFAVASALGIALAPATSSNGVHVGWGSDSQVRAV